MSNINLYQSEQTSEKSARSDLFDKGLIIGALIFFLVLAGYGGLEMYLGALDKKIADSRLEEARGRGLLKGGDVDLVASFGQRLGMLEVGKEVFAKNNPTGIFKAVQDSMVSGVVASRIGVQDKALSISFVADNFEILAKQILSFKKNSFFQDVEIKSSTQDEKGKVNVELAMTLGL